MEKTLKNVDDVVIRFAGDSGDGMQLTGGRFTDTTAIVGNDLSTLPDFPAEIRAPAGSLAGVSAGTRRNAHLQYGCFLQKESDLCRFRFQSTGRWIIGRLFPSLCH